MIIELHVDKIIDSFWEEFSEITGLDLEVGLFNMTDVRYLMNIYFGYIHDMHMRAFMIERFRTYVGVLPYDHKLWTKLETLGWDFLEEIEAAAKRTYGHYKRKDFDYRLKYGLQIIQLISRHPIEGIDSYPETAHRPLTQVVAPAGIWARSHGRGSSSRSRSVDDSRRAPVRKRRVQGK